MSELMKLNRPWLVAVWPGMGHVAVSAGFYLMSKLDMHLLAELETQGLFDVEHVDVKDGILRTASLPRNRFFIWRDPQGYKDLVVFIGEAQPPQGKYAFCRRLVEFAKTLGVEQVFTFAAMATSMHPERPSRVLCAATDEQTLQQLQKLELTVLRTGHISGLNGILLGAAAEIGLHGGCLLGEMPHIFSQLPYPKASLSVLKAFTNLANLDLDFKELEEQVQAMDDKLGELLASLEPQRGSEPDEGTDEAAAEPSETNIITAEDRARINKLFEQAEADRAKAYELKRELDRLEVFQEYEDRFLDLFQKPE